MFGILLTLLILDGILLMVIVLLQSGKGGGLAAMGGGGGSGTDSFMGSRQAATVLTKSSWISGGAFIVLAILLSILSSRSDESTPLLEDEFRATPTAPQPILPGVGEGEAEGAAPAGEGGEVVPGVQGGAGAGEEDASGGEAGGE